ncbi:hypothetical protein K445DRAFT_323201 [Daldinia sp. EC12]|nr:hypothetical protein K445DRAFT_323201 [Daldinia sp. EC12]
MGPRLAFRLLRDWGCSFMPLTFGTYSVLGCNCKLTPMQFGALYTCVVDIEDEC